MPRAQAKVDGAKKKVPKKGAYQMPEHLPSGTILTDMSKQQWRIGTSIGTGGFGEIYAACKAGSISKTVMDYPNVVKIEPHSNGPLFVEMHFYMRNARIEDIEKFRKEKSLKSIGMPHFVGNGSHNLNDIKHRFLVMPRYGKDVGKLFLENDKRLPNHTIYRLGIQMLDILEYIHKCTYVHGDLKGSNILLGLGKNGDSQAYLVDFGLACHYTTSPTFKPDPKKMHNGTIEYTSRDAHYGVPTMRGDFEILGYNMLHWWGVTLPWDKNNLLKTPSKVQESKETFMKSVDVSLKNCFPNGCPDPLSQYINYIGKLKFNETPDYNKCRNWFDAGLKSFGKTSVGALDFKMSTSTTPLSIKNKEIIDKNAVVNITKKAVVKTKKATSIKSVIIESSDMFDSSEDEKPNKKILKRTKSKKPTEAESSSDDDSVEIIQRKKQRNGSSAKLTTVKSSNELNQAGSTTINNSISKSGKKTHKTYELNFELDVSVDANIVINVKRKADTKLKDKVTRRKKN